MAPICVQGDGSVVLPAFHGNRDLLANFNAAIDSKEFLQSAQLGDQTLYPAAQDLFVIIEFLFMAIVRLPSHALWPRRKIPILGVELANRTQPRIDLGLAVMSATLSIHKL